MGAPGSWRAPGPPGAQPMTVERFRYLVDLDMDAIEQRAVQAIADFADMWIAGGITNQPLRMNIDTLVPELGPSSFPGAREAWQLLLAL